MMSNRTRGFAALPLLILCGAAALPASAQTSPSAQAASLQYLAGTWSCSFQTPDGQTHMLSQTIAPENGYLHGTGSSGSYQQQFYVMYDARHSQFAMVQVDNGGYQLLVSDSPTLNGSTWRDAYPAGSGQGVFTEVSPTQYTIVSSWTENGQPMSSHDTCTKP